MSNLTKKELRYEIWAMLPDKCKKIMENIKETYLDSMIADAESFSNGQILKILKDEYGCNGILSIEWAATKKRQLKVYFKNNKCNEEKIKAIIFVKKGMAFKAFKSNIQQGKTDNLKKQIKKGTVTIYSK